MSIDPKFCAPDSTGECSCRKFGCDPSGCERLLHEYAFDVKLFAVVRVKAESLEKAQAAMRLTVDALEPTGDWIAGFNSAAKVKVTEVSLDQDGEGENETPFEIDGEDT